MIAAEAAQKVGRGESFGNYPADTLFNDFRVSYVQDLSELNDGEKFIFQYATQNPSEKIFLSFRAACHSHIDLSQQAFSSRQGTNTTSFLSIIKCFQVISGILQIGK